jgi:sporulation-control protein
MLKQLLASVGIGKAKVDTLLLVDKLQAGQTFDIEVVIQGGDVEQQLQGLEFAIMASAKTEADLGDSEVEYNKSVVLQSWQESFSLTIQPGETVTKQFTLDLHPEVPATYLFGHQIGKVWLQTGLDIKSGVDASDKDGLTIVPSATQLAVLQLISDSGYRLFKSDIESGRVRARGLS